MSADRESMIHELPQDDPRQPSKSITVVKVIKIVLLCYQLTKTSIFFSPTSQHFLCSYIWSKSEVSTTTVAKATKIVLLCYQLTKISNFFSPTIQHFLYSYIWSKSEVSMTTVAKVTKFVLLCYQLTKISKNLAQPHNNSYIAISSQNLKSLQPLQPKLDFHRLLWSSSQTKKSSSSSFSSSYPALCNRAQSSGYSHSKIYF